MGLWSRPSFFSRMFPRTVIYASYPPEVSPQLSLQLSKKGFYKGSHSAEYEKYILLSFGDHEIQPRHTFPDILWNPDHYPDSLKLRLKDVIGTKSEKELGKRVALLMSALREGAVSLGELSKATRTSEKEIKRLADFLVDLNYLIKSGDKYSSRVPILTGQDYSLIRRIRQIGREELEGWLESGYPQLQKELNQLTPFKYGVSQSILFYDIWHDIFGAANRTLVESGLFADPYSEYYGAKGFIPAVYAESLYKKP